MALHNGWCLALVLGVAMPAIASDKLPSDPARDPVMVNGGFLEAHPDLRYRLLGLEKYKSGDHADAFKFFRRAGYYADKPSQGMVAEMLWNGQGVDRDPVQAYIWMDLAAERGYEGFLALRERYWNQLDEAQRARAVEDGQAVYAVYGDDAAKPRIATVLRRELRNMTGSRLGSTGNLKVLVPGPAGSMQEIDGSKFYDPRYWNPEQYQQWHDAIWSKPRVGKVEVGELNQVNDGGARSRVPRVEPRTDAEEPSVPETPAEDAGSGER